MARRRQQIRPAPSELRGDGARSRVKAGVIGRHEQHPLCTALLDETLLRLPSLLSGLSALIAMPLLLRSRAPRLTLPLAWLVGASVNVRRWARALVRDVHAVALAARDPRVPWYAKALALAVAAYALSPIDLIPDMIPVLGYLDDLLIVPLGLALVVRMIPAPLARAASW